MINIDNYLRLDLVDVTLVLISTFLMVMFAKKYFWKYVQEYLEKREALIQKELDDASNRDIESKKLLDEARQKIYDVQEQANEIMDRVEAAGGTILVPKTQISEDNGYMGIIKDTEGNRIGLHSNPLT